MELEFGGGPLRLRAREMKCKTIQVLWHGKVRSAPLPAAAASACRPSRPRPLSATESALSRLNCPTLLSRETQDPKKQDPVYSVDFNPSSGLLVTCGADKEIKVSAICVICDTKASLSLRPSPCAVRDAQNENSRHRFF